MTFDEILTTLHDLPRDQKVRAFQFLTSELAEETDPELRDGGSIAIWSPIESYDAAKTLTEYLEQHPDR